jgi:hypothetical protein
MFYQQHAVLRLAVYDTGVAALPSLASIVQLSVAQNRLYWPMVWLAALMALTAGYRAGRELHEVRGAVILAGPVGVFHAPKADSNQYRAARA